MTVPGAIIVAAALFAGTLLLTSQTQSQSTTIGRYQISGSSQEGKTAWRVDTATGDVVFCQVTGAPPGTVTCEGAKP